MGHLATKATPQGCPYVGKLGASRSFQNGFHHKVPRVSSPVGKVSHHQPGCSSPAPPTPTPSLLPSLPSPTCLVSREPPQEASRGEKYLQGEGTRSLILFYYLEFLCLRLAPGLPGSITTYHIKQSGFFFLFFFFVCLFVCFCLLLSGFLGNHERSVKNFV